MVHISKDITISLNKLVALAAHTVTSLLLLSKASLSVPTVSLLYLYMSNESAERAFHGTNCATGKMHITIESEWYLSLFILQQFKPLPPFLNLIYIRPLFLLYSCELEQACDNNKGGKRRSASLVAFLPYGQLNCLLHLNSIAIDPLSLVSWRRVKVVSELTHLIRPLNLFSGTAFCILIQSNW